MSYLRQIREDRGISRERFAEMVGTTATTIYRKETGLRKLTQDDIELYANALGCDPAELLGGEAVVSNKKTVPLVGYVGAGAQIFPIDDHAKGQGLAEVDCPHNIDHKKGVALEVRGDSMEPLISDGFLLFYEERFHGVPAEYINRICVVWIEGDGCLVKKIRKGTKPGYYTLESLNNSTKPIENARVAYTAFVKTMVQR